MHCRTIWDQSISREAASTRARRATGANTGSLSHWVRGMQLTRGTALHRTFLVAFLAVALAGCSSDPDRRKLKYLSSGEAYFNAGKYREAVIQFRNAVRLDPRFATAHSRLGEGYLRLGNSEAAYGEFMEAAALDPKDTGAQLHLADLLISRRQFDQAQSAAQAAARISGGHRSRSPTGRALCGPVGRLSVRGTGGASGSC